MTLRGNRFANPAGLVELIQQHAGTLKLRPDQKLVYLRNWDDEKERMTGVAGLMQALVKIARAGSPGARQRRCRSRPRNWSRPAPPAGRKAKNLFEFYPNTENDQEQPR